MSLGRLAKRWWNHRYPDWVADMALRYLPIADAITSQPPRGPILEVGINRFGLTTYLPRPVVGVDCVIGPARSSLVRPVLARGQALPFGAQAFDDTVCLDTLEHVPEAERIHFLGELVRVTRRRLYVGCPMGPEAERADRELQAYYRQLHGQSFPFLDEHVAYGLPEVETVEGWIHELARSCGRTVRIARSPNQNVRVHRLLLRLWMRTDPVSYALHRLAVLLVHVRRWLNVGSCYRHIIMADFDGGRA